MPYTRSGVRHKQVRARVDSEGKKNCASPCPAGGSNPGSADLNSDALTATELRPLFDIVPVDNAIDGVALIVTYTMTVGNVNDFVNW